jgi:hypothetical protein
MTAMPQAASAAPGITRRAPRRRQVDAILPPQPLEVLKIHRVHGERPGIPALGCLGQLPPQYSGADALHARP